MGALGAIAKRSHTKGFFNSRSLAAGIGIRRDALAQVQFCDCGDTVALRGWPCVGEPRVGGRGRAIPIMLLRWSGSLIGYIAVGWVFVEHLDFDALVRVVVLAELVSD